MLQKYFNNYLKDHYPDYKIVFNEKDNRWILIKVKTLEVIGYYLAKEHQAKLDLKGEAINKDPIELETAIDLIIETRKVLNRLIEQVNFYIDYDSIYEKDILNKISDSELEKKEVLTNENSIEKRTFWNWEKIIKKIIGWFDKFK
jgi:hypothetical protein